jgi:membrane protease YdiL (CAAX protease family)
MTEESQNSSIQLPSLDDVLPTRLTIIERYKISPLLFSILSLIFLFFLYQGVGGIITILLFGSFPMQENITGFRTVTGLGQIVLLLIPTLLLVRFATFTPKRYLRVRMPDVRTLILPLIGIFSLQQVLQIYMVFQEKIPLPESMNRVIQQFKDLLDSVYKMLVSSESVPELFFVLMIVALIPAIVEELLFRGMILRGFEKQLGSVKGIVFTGIIFATYHLNPFSFIPLAVIGIYLGFLAVRANSVWVASIAHFFNNALACLAVYFHLDDDAIVTGNPSEMSIGVLITTFVVFAIVFFVSTYYFIQITSHSVQSIMIGTPSEDKLKYSGKPPIG